MFAKVQIISEWVIIIVKKHILNIDLCKINCNFAIAIAIVGFCRHIEESAFRLFLLRKLDTYRSNMGVRRKTLLLFVFVFNAKYNQAELLFYLFVLQGVQPYAADERMLAPLFFCMP